MRSSTVLSLAALGSIASGYQLPAKLKSLYDQHKSGSCSKKLSGDFPAKTSYCGDIPNVIFLKSPGGYDNMDIDCDGANRSGGACANDPSGQGETAFKDTVKTYGIPDLDANIHPYVVFGNEGGKPSFNAEAHGIKPLSVMAVVCNGQVHYGIWGDTNGGTSTGEASLAMGKLCFPNEHLTGNNGHDPKDVLYIAFTGADTVPGKNGANWKAKNSDEFAKSIKSLGDKLVGRL
ncbi:endo-chitosanase [Cordyceps fumosorosea ARSEF 2679]|uniref:Endo-chitosanase n=1 Tax=Cordyceps fumosorosea (strain ARSEF 2679) TaxID=1081104 RepID=A0A167PLB9_CORFA|nr:endo-chitosanase [Cordyceps fumosorosea ARSEF 2679]OAA56778.1 endo-chitosanase [Cordyceps fumosorosea ARSEF 2679]